MPTRSRLRKCHGIAFVADQVPWQALERYEEVLQRTRSAIWEVDAHGYFTYVSRSLESLLGYTKYELIGKRHIDSFYPATMAPH